MINSLSGNLGSHKSESSSRTKVVQSLSTSPNESSSNIISMSKKANTHQSSDLLDQTGLTPPSLNFPSKFDLDGDTEVQSPDSSAWETFFSDHFDSDFMVMSPVRNLSYSPSGQSSGCNFNYLDAMQVQSPPRNMSPLGPFNSNNNSRVKGMSPLHRVFNSPGNNFMQIESLSLPPLDPDFPYEYPRNQDHHHHHQGGYHQAGASKLSLTTTALFDDMPTSSVPAGILNFKCLGIQNNSGFCESSTGGGSSHDRDLYSQIGTTASLSEQLQQELRHEKQQDQQQQQQPVPSPTASSSSTQPTPPGSQQNLNHTLMVSVPIGSDQGLYASVRFRIKKDSGLQLVHLLLACAEAVAKEDYMLARRYLHHLNRVVTPLGDSMQRVASCFTEALSARLAATLTANPSSSTTKPFSPFPPNSMEIHKIYQILYQACPYIKFAHFTANQAIFEAFEAEERVHVIDLDILQGYQWPAFMQALAARPGGSPSLRITGVGSSIEGVREAGRCLSELAHSLNVPFEFHPVAEELEDLEPHMFNRRVGEALAVNSVNRLHRVPGNRLGNLLAMIRDQAPNIVTLVEQEASHNGPYFLGRFLEALHYYSAIFDSLDATFPPDSSQRAQVEQYIFAPEIRNIVACEGAERIVRHERLEKWMKLMEGKGFKGVALTANAVTQSKILMGLYSCDGYRLTEDKGCLLLGWEDRAILAASAWRC